MRLLYVCGTYAPGALAGSELSAHTLLRELARRRRAEVVVVTDQRYTGGSPGHARHEGVPIVGIAHETRAEAIPAALAELEPDVVLTQLVWADVALSAAAARGLPAIYRVASLPVGLDLRRGSPSSPAAVLAISRYVADRVRAESGREAVVLPSPIDLRRVVARERRPRFVTLFNPIRRKGGEILRAVARLLPEREFAVVPGWHSLRDHAGRFDPEQFRRAWQTAGLEYGGELPREVDFSDLPNVTTLAARAEVAEIYAQTRLLLVPSLWEEAYGRVAVEAFANGIPVLAAPVGGLAEHGAAGGRLVEGHPDPAAWAEAIRRLDDPAAYRELERRGRDYVERHYDLDRIVERFAELARALVPRPPAIALARARPPLP